MKKTPITIEVDQWYRDHSDIGRGHVLRTLRNSAEFENYFWRDPAWDAYNILAADNLARGAVAAKNWVRRPLGLDPSRPGVGTVWAARDKIYRLLGTIGASRPLLNSCAKDAACALRSVLSEFDWDSFIRSHRLVLTPCERCGGTGSAQIGRCGHCGPAFHPDCRTGFCFRVAQ